VRSTVASTCQAQAADHAPHVVGNTARGHGDPVGQGARSFLVHHVRVRITSPLYDEGRA